MSFKNTGRILDHESNPLEKVFLLMNCPVSSPGCSCCGISAMGLSKRVSLWSVEEVLEWAQDQFPAHMGTLQKAIIKHAISGTSYATK